MRPRHRLMNVRDASLIVVLLLSLLSTPRSTALGTHSPAPGGASGSLLPPASPTPSNTATPAPPRIWTTLSASQVAVGGTVLVTIRTDLSSMARLSLTIIDQSTGLEQDQTSPIVTPARLGGTVISGQTSLTLTGARPGAVRVRTLVSGSTGIGTVDSETLTVTSGGTPSATPSPTATPTSTATPPRVSLKAQYKANDSSTTDNQIKPGLRVINTGTGSVALSDITLRYWYTADGAQSQSYSCDYTAVGCSNVTGSFTALGAPLTDADRYLEIGFKSTAGSLAPGANSGEIQSRINKTDWSSYNEANDYSYGGAQTSFADWSTVTVYFQGRLVWGSEPNSGPTNTPTSTPTKTPTITPTRGPCDLLSGEVTIMCTPAPSYTPTPTNTPSPTTTRTVTPWPTPRASVSAAPSSLQVGGTVLVTASSNLGIPSYSLTVIDQSTGLEQDQSNPIFTPARPAPIAPIGSSVSWTLTAARPGTVVFRVSVHGEFFGQCGCCCLTTVMATSTPVSVASGPTPTDTPTPTPTPGSSGLKVQYRAANTNAGDNQVRPHFNIVNTGGSPVPLSGLTVRYWYTVDGDKAQSFACDYAIVGCANVRGAFVKLAAPRTGADSYLELSFSGTGSIAAGGQSGEIQSRFNKADWTTYNESDDYSFDPTKTAFADWTRVTLYRNGVLVWGAEP